MMIHADAIGSRLAETETKVLTGLNDQWSALRASIREQSDKLTVLQVGR